jgi:hypothetical protein
MDRDPEYDRVLDDLPVRDLERRPWVGQGEVRFGHDQAYA